MTAETTDRQIHSFRVAEGREAKFHAIITKFQKRATKLGVEGPKVVKFERVERKVVKDVGFDSHLPQLGVERIEVHFAADVACQPVKLAGWSFLATLAHEEGGTVIRPFPGAVVPEIYRTAKPYCEHCDAKRRRTETFVVQHEDGTLKQVGRQCLADFLGADPARALWVTEFEREMRAAEGDESDGGFGGHSAYDSFAEYLLWVAKEIRENGFTSRKAADAYNQKVGDGGPFKQTTASLAQGAMSAFYSRTIPSHEKPLPPTKEDAAEVERAIAWAKGLRESGKTLSDFEHNLTVVAHSAAILPKNFGIAAAIIPAFQREEGRLKQAQSRRRADEGSVHFGTVGKRAVFTLTVVAHQSFDGDYGTRHLYRFKDEHGNVATWWTGSAVDFDGREILNRTFFVKATVKKHDDYKGIAQTVLSRATFEGESRQLSTTSALL